jgi:hypothetical protein
MIYDHRTYICKVGTLAAHIKLYEDMGYAVQSRHLGEPVLWATTEVGDVNSYVHIWAYKDLAERTVKRAAMWSDPEWLAYVKKSAELGALIHQECKILVGKRFK